MPTAAVTTTVALLLPLLAAPGCSSDSPRDHVAGAWQDLDDETGELVGTVVFTDDGKFTSTPVGGGDPLEGTWEATDDQMTVDFDIDGESVLMQMTYYADGEVLMAPTLLPDGPVDGVVGSWRGEATTSDDGESFTGVTTLELDDDGGASRRHTDTGEPEESNTGSWRQAEDEWIELDTRNADGEDEDFRFFTVPGRAIGHDPLVRVE